MSATTSAASGNGCALDHLTQHSILRMPVVPGDGAPVTEPHLEWVVDITIHATFLPHDAPDASLAFYHDRPEVVPVVLLLLRAGPG